MFNVLANLTKAALSVAVSPVTLAIDVAKNVTKVLDGEDFKFDATGAVFNNASECIAEAIKANGKQ